jgi:hypothetical protein
MTDQPTGMTDEQRVHLEDVSNETLVVFETIAADARRRLVEVKPRPEETFASVNAFTMPNAVKTLDRVDKSERDACQSLAREPAIARIVVMDSMQHRITYFVSRAAAPRPPPPGVNVASYRSPLGRLAALPPGETEEVDLPALKNPTSFTMMEKASLHPTQKKDGWDSADTDFESDTFGPITIESLRRFIARGPSHIALDELARILQDEEAARGIFHGRRRRVITRMELRDQPILDRFQDEIFRLPLNRRLALIGPPGSGKTTTLIRRLGQKLDSDHLTPEELNLVARAEPSRTESHSRSWLMFTPTELLRQYVKEAFAREGIAASDEHIRTWSTHRRELARNTFNVLRTGGVGGPFIMKDDEPTLRSDAVGDSIGWLNDFNAWQSERLWNDLRQAAAHLVTGGGPKLAELAGRLSAVVAREGADHQATAVLPLLDLTDVVREQLEQFRSENDRHITAALTLQVRRNPHFVDDLAAFMDTLIEGTEETDEDEGDETIGDDDDEAAPQTRRGAAIAAFRQALRAQARNRVSGRRTGRGRAALILDWLGDRILPDTECEVVGRTLALQRSLRRFASPVREYLNGVPRRYAAFRRIRRAQERWYTPQQPGWKVNPLEVDVILVAMLRASRELLLDRRIQSGAADPGSSFLSSVSALQRNQIVVDEMTDFSPIQLACMASLTAPSIRSFFACGDFHQRITRWGIRSEEELRWVWPDIELREVNVAYRQTRQLLAVAAELAELSGGRSQLAALPEAYDAEGVDPVLAIDTADGGTTVTWPAQRIIEIDAAIRPNPLPSVAVLVNGEDEVRQTADALNQALEPHNLRAIACVYGQSIGQENEVRVFDVQHIKGLEFEAVFFVGIDRLAEREPELFDKYLYVGATRAATYLGMTCVGQLPARIAHLKHLFRSAFRPRESAVDAMRSK